jgi:phosphoserine phosphatase RsbU/P
MWSNRPNFIPRRVLGDLHNFEQRLLKLTLCCMVGGFSLCLVGLLITLTVFKNDISEQTSRRQLEAGQNYLSGYLGANLAQLNAELTNASAQLQTLGAVAQTLEDNKESWRPVFAALGKTSLGDKLQRTPSGGWQSIAGGAAVVSVLPYLVGSDGQIKPEVAQQIEQTQLFNLLFPLTQRYNLAATRLGYYGSPDQTYVRFAPWSDYLQGLATSAPQSYATVNPWQYLPGGLQEAWEIWATQPATKVGLDSEVVVGAPYRSVNGQQLMINLYMPVWDKARQKVQGCLALNLALEEAGRLMENLELPDGGFGFLSQPDGNILLVSGEGERVLGLVAAAPTSASEPVTLRQTLHETSPFRLQPSAGDEKKVVVSSVVSANQTYSVAQAKLKALNSVSSVSPPKNLILPQEWNLTLVVPQAAFLTASPALEPGFQALTGWLVLELGIIFGLLLAVFVIILFQAFHNLNRLLKVFADGTLQLQEWRAITIGEKGNGELQGLSQTFNSMVGEIKEHTRNLENLVKERTHELERANQEILRFNERLNAENTRMRTELEVTHQLQEMILPRQPELESIRALDIASFMQPADEVGGDYYDVIEQNGIVKIGIGDVTGHGLESGVLMIMLQTAVRTLVECGEVNSAQALGALNRTIYNNVRRMRSDKNLTLTLLDYSDGNLRLSGQHEDLILIRADGTLELIDTSELGFPIGLEADITPFIAERYIRLNAGDTLVLYTDGITEAENPQGVQYGLERFCEVVRYHYDQPATIIKQAVIDDLLVHINAHKVYDDITLLVIKQKAVTA